MAPKIPEAGQADSRATARALAEAEQALQRGDPARARQLLAPLDAAGRLSGRGLHLLAIIEKRLGRPLAARTYFEAALGVDPDDPDLHNNYGNLLDALGERETAAGHYRQALALKPGMADAAVNLGLVEQRLGRLAEARLAFEQATATAPANARAWHALGALLFQMAQHEPAAAALDRALALKPTASVLHLRALVESELGGIAAPYYARARILAPDDLDLALGEAVSRYQGGETALALQAMEDLALSHPHWLKAHASLAKLRWETGAQDSFTGSYQAALRDAPDNDALWTAYAATLMRAGLHGKVLDVLDAARAAVGPAGWFDRLEAAAASEDGQGERADRLYAQLQSDSSSEVAIAHARHLLRAGRFEQAASRAAAVADRDDGAGVWPYLAAAWRVLGDARAQWLEGDPRLIGVVDLGEAVCDLPGLADLLRSLHASHAHPFDQTLRGGTQTLGSLLARRDAPIGALRRLLERAIADYIGQLPFDAGHPFLRRKAETFQLAGSWSSRLCDGGFHLNHVHPGGWISSAFYVALPDGIGQDETDQSGWLTFGCPPSQLGVKTPPIRSVQPKAGRLVLFPSLMWHGTLPFATGERLTIAFDVTAGGV